MLFDCATRPWYQSEIDRLQRLVDRAYRYIWMKKNQGPALIQMENMGINMYGIRGLMKVDSIRRKIEKRCLERIGHVLRMPNDRMTKKITLGWLKQQPDVRKGGQTTISYWRRLVKECNLDPDNIEPVAMDRREWKAVANRRMGAIREWEIKMTEHHRLTQGPKPQRSQFRSEDHLSNICDWDGCGQQCKTVAGLKHHQRRMHRGDRKVVSLS